MSISFNMLINTFLLQYNVADVVNIVSEDLKLLHLNFPITLSISFYVLNPYSLRPLQFSFQLKISTQGYLSDLFVLKLNELKHISISSSGEIVALPVSPDPLKFCCLSKLPYGSRLLCFQTNRTNKVFPRVWDVCEKIHVRSELK